MKSYLRNKISPYTWEMLSKMRKSPVLFLKDSIDDVSLNIRFFLKKRKGFSSVTCLVPFMRLEFQGAGNVSACCLSFTKVKSVGNMTDQTIEEIWNGKKMQKFRKSLFMGETKKTCMPNCGYLKEAPVLLDKIRTDTEEGKLLHEDIMNGRVKVRSYPVRFNLANSGICNLKCAMCRDMVVGQGNNPYPEYVKKTVENLSNYFEKKIILFLCGNGDVLARKDTRELLQNFDSEKYNKVSFQILTNGLLFQPKMWETIKHNNFTYVSISVDAATKETYEKIRRGGKWEQLMKAFEVFRKAREEGKFSSVNLNMVVMRSNYREIPQFVEMARSRGFNAIFTKIRGEWGDENIFETNDNGALQELKRVLSNPDIYGDDTDMNELIDYVPREIHSRITWYKDNSLNEMLIGNVSGRNGNTAH